MATVTKPIALDESLNTTEQTPRNVADVLAQELARIAGRQASDVDYDNTDSGLTADNVQDAIDELKSDIPTVNDGTLTIQQNGETKGTFTANQSGNSTVNIEIPTTDIQTAVDEFETYNGGILSSLKVALSPNQDLHGYPNPWVGGAGKNKVPLTLNNLKAINTSGTWSGNVFTSNNVTFTVQTDSDGNVINIKVTGTPTSRALFHIFTTDVGGYIQNNFKGMILNGSNQNFSGNNGIYIAYSNNGASWADEQFQKSSEVTIKNNDYLRIEIMCDSGTFDNDFKPMIRLATETDPTFEPYENICPISGHTQSKVGDDGKNLISGIENGAVDDYGSPSASAYRCRTVEFTHIKPNTQYTLKALSDDGTLEYIVRTFEDADGSYRISDNGGWHQGAFTFTSQVNAHDLKVIFRFSNNASIDASQIYNVQLELGSTATAYVPYNGYQVTVNLGGTYYSGTLDVVSGVFTPDTAKYVLTDVSALESYTTDTSVDSWGSWARIKRTEYPSIKEDVSSELASSCKVVAYADRSVNTHDNRCYVNFDSVIIRASVDENVTTVNELFAIFENCEFILPLATPTPIQLSPTMVKALVGENHLSAPLDGQEITESKYREGFTFDDVIAYIQSL